MIDVIKPRDGCLYEIRQKGQRDPCYVVVPDTTDLVKSHLMFAVREEVEVLKERIAELMERINQLEVENSYLRAHASQDTLAQLPAAGAKPPPQPQGPQPPVS
ncbi:hypothetical protein KGM_201530 [Danaus plexippus plexippus]|uniref:TSC22 domain family protein 4 n=1 Tax=Danaus plexippus plexippus TaxID=278856 RepID=A0A212EPC3_DANPL|nr:hypothetical protein KGM_201530 [Danaus plexippus plexippus]